MSTAVFSVLVMLFVLWLIRSHLGAGKRQPPAELKPPTVPPAPLSPARGRPPRRPVATEAAPTSSSRSPSVPPPSPPPIVPAAGKATWVSFQSAARKDYVPSNTGGWSPGGNPARWIPAKTSARIHGFDIEGGMVYCGEPSHSTPSHPALLNPALPVTRGRGPIAELPYFPTYDRLPPTTRYAYLEWLSGGRLDSSVQIGFPFLFFYGLERRVLVELPADARIRAELPAIGTEIRRLRALFAEQASFRRYSGGLLEYLDMLDLQALETSQDLGAQPSAEASPIRILAGLGWHALEGRPLPVNWALAYVLQADGISLGTVVSQFGDQFRASFRHHYAALFGAGMALSENKARISYTYAPASGDLHHRPTTLRLESFPDVSAIVGPTRKLQEVVDLCKHDLGKLRKVSRDLSAKDPVARGKEIQLPSRLWTNELRAALGGLRKEPGAPLEVTTLESIRERLGLPELTGRKLPASLQDALHEIGMAIEPAIGPLGKLPPAGEPVALFPMSPGESSLLDTPAGRSAELMLDLGSSLAHIDGTVDAAEKHLLLTQINLWPNLNENQRRRLRARMRLAIDRHQPIKAMVTRVEAVPVEGRRAIGHLLVAIAAVDGEVTAAERKLINKAYRALGLSTAEASADITAELSRNPRHPQGMPRSPAATTPAAPTIGTPGQVHKPQRVSLPRVELDEERVASIQRETAEVAALLAQVFADEPALTVPAPSPDDEADEEDDDQEDLDPAAPSLLGLDAEHSDFLRHLLTHAAWSRQSLEELAADRNLMLDGALERINDVAFERFDAALIEGDDPLEIRLDLMETQLA